MDIISGKDEMTEGFKSLHQNIKSYTLVWNSSLAEATDTHEKK